MDETARRKLWKQWIEAGEAHYSDWARHGYRYPPPLHVPMPDAVKGLSCGARTRAGTPCKRKDIYRSGRCKLHGGLSTGPRTKAGKAICAGNARKRTP